MPGRRRAAAGKAHRATVRSASIAAALRSCRTARRSSGCAYRGPIVDEQHNRKRGEELHSRRVGRKYAASSGECTRLSWRPPNGAEFDEAIRGAGLAAAAEVTDVTPVSLRIPVATYRLQFNANFTFTQARIDRELPRGARDQRLLRLVVPAGRSGQRPRVRHRRSHDAQSRDRHRRRLLVVDRGAAAGQDGPHPRRRAEPHGHRAIGEPVVDGRARERAELALRAFLRHRVEADQGRAGRQGAAPDPRRLLRIGARGAAAHPRVSRRRVRRALRRRLAAARAGHVSAHSPRGAVRRGPAARPTWTSCGASLPPPRTCRPAPRATRTRSSSARARRRSSSGVSPPS